MEPSSRITSTSTVGLPRLSRISRAVMSTISVMKGLKAFGSAARLSQLHGVGQLDLGVTPEAHAANRRIPMLLVERQDAVAVVTLNRPEAMNALSKALRAALRQALTELDADPTVKVVVLTGTGERAFTAGLDLKELGTDPLGMALPTRPIPPRIRPAPYWPA